MKASILNDGRIVYYCDENGESHSHKSTPGNLAPGELPEQVFDSSSIVEHYEKVAGCRVDSCDFNNDTVAGLMGMMARALGRNPHGPEHDVCAGILMQHQMSPAGQAEREANAALASMLTAGFAPEDLLAMRNLNGDKRD